MGGTRYRQIFLFLAILILPGIMIAVQGRWLSLQERELARTRLEEIRKRTAAEIGQDVVTRLERIRAQELANRPATPTRGYRPSDPAVVAVGWVEADRLVWPWDPASEERETPTPNAAFAEALAAGRRAEFAEQRLDRALGLYRQAIGSARDDAERAAARLALARIQARTGQRTASAAVYRDVLRLSSALTDEHGLTYWSSAATPLAELGGARDVLERVTSDLESSSVWPPIQLYRFRSILQALQASTEENVPRAASLALQRLEPRLLDLEAAERLRQDFQRLSPTATEWQPYPGSELWLVGRSPDRATGRPLVLAVRWDTIRQVVESERQARQAGPRFEVAVSGPGDPLSDSLPDLRVTFPDGVADVAVGLSAQRSQWGLSVALVALLTLLGGYLLWRDVRREARVAELRTQFVSSVSHELKTPLTSIRMFAELLQMRGSADPQQRRFLHTIVSESERLTRLLNNVLDVSRIERGQKTYHPEPTPLLDVVQAAVRAIQYPLTQQGFTLDVNVTPGIPAVSVDRDALQQAILNLLTNAMKYSGDQREIQLRLCRLNGSAVIQVADRGIGIAEGEQARIFEKFYRAPIPENQEISGTGLGLSLVAHIVAAQGGSVQIESRPGEGSTFSILLPLSEGGVG